MLSPESSRWRTVGMLAIALRRFRPSRSLTAVGTPVSAVIPRSSTVAASPSAV